MLFSGPRPYCQRYGLTVKDQLGGGIQGVVLAATQGTLMSAVKSLRDEAFYLREKAVYLRLREQGVSFIEGFKIPRLLNVDDELWVIEMQVVASPFVLDFASAYLDERPPYTEEQWDEWQTEKAEQFEDRWETVQTLMAVFRRYGIHLADVKPGNIMFADDG